MIRRRTKPRPKAPWTEAFPQGLPSGVNLRREYLRNKRKFLMEHLICVRCLAPNTEVHHTRGRLGALLTAEQFWCALCAACHRWVHDNPIEARAVGLLCENGEWNTVPNQTKSKRKKRR
jgi:hypothetical protein